MKCPFCSSNVDTPSSFAAATDDPYNEAKKALQALRDTLVGMYPDMLDASVLTDDDFRLIAIFVDAFEQDIASRIG